MLINCLVIDGAGDTVTWVVTQVVLLNLCRCVLGFCPKFSIPNSPPKAVHSCVATQVDLLMFQRTVRRPGFCYTFRALFARLVCAEVLCTQVAKIFICVIKTTSWIKIVLPKRRIQAESSKR